MKRLTQKQKSELIKNPNVLKLHEYQISYRPEFKISAVKRFVDGVSADRIFTEAGFDRSFFRPRYFSSCLRHWYLKFRRDASFEFASEKRNGGSLFNKNYHSLANLSVDELKAIILVQDEVIATVKKKKALARKV